MKKLAVLAIASAVVLTGCSATPYQSMKGSGGYRETRINETTYEITGRVNGVTRSYAARQFAMLRAADIACSNGYRFFRILDEHNHYPARQSDFTTSVLKIQLTDNNLGQDYDAKIIMDDLAQSKKVRDSLSCTF